MSGTGGRKPAVPGGEEAEVEALLRAAQDAVMLKLQANSHLVSSTSAPTPPSLDAAAAAPDPLDDDLARRFDALKSRAHAPAPNPAAGAGGGSGGMEELTARFAALKGAAGPEKETRVKLEDLGGESSEDEEEEVDKLMRWAMDAARLDVATAGVGAGDKAKKQADEEDDKDEKSSVSSEDEDDEDEAELLRLCSALRSAGSARSAPPAPLAPLATTGRRLAPRATRRLRSPPADAPLRSSRALTDECAGNGRRWRRCLRREATAFSLITRRGRV